MLHPIKRQSGMTLYHLWSRFVHFPGGISFNLSQQLYVYVLKSWSAGISTFDFLSQSESISLCETFSTVIHLSTNYWEAISLSRLSYSLHGTSTYIVGIVHQSDIDNELFRVWLGQRCLSAFQHFLLIFHIINTKSENEQVSINPS